MFDQFTKGFQSFKFPQVDAGKFFAIQQKNVETLSSVAQAWGESTQEFAKKTTEFAQQNVESALNASRDVFTTSAPEQNAAKQGEFAKKTVATCTKQARELADLATKSQFKAFETLNKRFNENVEEVTELAKAKKEAA